MVLMLCLGTAARADLVVGYGFNGSLEDCSGNGNEGSIYEGTEAYSSDSPSTGSSGGQSLDLDGASSVEMPIDGCIFSGDTDFSIVAWFNTSDTDAAGCIISCGPGGDSGDSHSMAVYMHPGNPDFDAGSVVYDNFYIGAAATESDGLNNGTWHHVAYVYTAANTEVAVYLDGALEGTPEELDPDFPCDSVTTLIGHTLNTVFPGEEGGDEAHWTGLLKDVGVYDNALDAAGVAEAKEGDDFRCYGPKNPLAVDANDVVIYEDPCTPLGDQYGNIAISLKFPPVGQGSPGNPDGTPISLEIIVDPNGFIDPCTGEVGGAGPNPDLTLIGGAGPNGQVSFTRNAGNWADVEVIRFQVVNDEIPEYPTLDEAQSIVVWAVPTPYEPNLARPVAQKVVGATVMDNDQPDIIFTLAPPARVFEHRDCVTLYQGICYSGWITYPQTVGVSLQVPPKDGGLVKLTMGMDTMGINNPPTTDPVIWTDPNFLVFSADGATYKGIPTRQYDNPFPITILGVDDDVLQAEDAGGEGDQNYNVDLVFHIVESGIGQPYDPRYGDYNAQDVWEDKIEKTFSISIEDNECGAFGTLDMDISNPYYVMTEAELGALLGNDRRDPNDWMDENGIPTPDCHVDMYDVLEIAWRWFNCSDPQNLKPGGPCESYIIP